MTTTTLDIEQKHPELPTVDEEQQLRNMLAQADSELSALHQEQVSLTKRMEAVSDELGSIQAKATARDQAVSIAKQEMSTKRANYEQSVAYAKLAPIDADAQAPVKDHEKQLRQVERALSALVEEASKERAGDQQRLTELLMEQEHCQHRLDAISRETIAMQGARAQAHTNLGDCIARNQARAVAEADAALAEIESKIAAARKHRDEVVLQSVRATAPWAEHCEKFMDQLTIDDAVTRCLGKDVAYMDQLLTDRFGLPSSLTESHITAREPYWWKILAIESDVLYQYRSLHDMRGAPELQARRDRSAQVLADYVHKKRHQWS